MEFMEAFLNQQGVNITSQTLSKFPEQKLKLWAM